MLMMLLLYHQIKLVKRDLTLEVTSLENNNASQMFLCNDSNNIRNFTFVGLTGTKKAGGLYKVNVTSGTSFTILQLTDTLTHTHMLKVVM